eukprot:COSAG03_NODE_63_length_15223_cov_32.095940_10_plen_189_part_00
MLQTSTLVAEIMPLPLWTRLASSFHSPLSGAIDSSPAVRASTLSPASIRAPSAMSPAMPEKQSKYAILRPAIATAACPGNALLASAGGGQLAARAKQPGLGSRTAMPCDQRWPVAALAWRRWPGGAVATGACTLRHFSQLVDLPLYRSMRRPAGWLSAAIKRAALPLNLRFWSARGLLPAHPLGSAKR